jgi:NADPH:quinone reductase-like Zn-dependent oxidoreductase
MMKTLQLLGYGDFEDNLQFAEVDIPQISANEVLVKVHAASINPHDYKVVLGEFRRMGYLKLPALVGSDFSGLVVNAGQNVSNINIGDAVYGIAHGALAEYCKVAAPIVSRKPTNLTFAQAASLPLIGTTTIQAFNRIGGINAGDRILIHAGSGGIGTFAIQYAKAKGAYVYTTTSAANIKWVKELGANVVIDYRSENYLNVCSDLDIVYDTLGGQYTFDAFKVIKPEGKVVSLLPAEINAAVAKELKIPPLIAGFFRLKPSKIKKLTKQKNVKYEFLFAQPNGHDLAEITALVADGKVKPIIEKNFEFERTVEAFKHLATGHTKGKLTIKINHYDE